MSPIGKSDHVCIALNPRCKIPGNKIKRSTVRPIKDSGLRNFGTWIQSLNWSEV